MKRLWICLLAFALLTGCGDSGDIAVTTVYETDDPPRTALTTEWETYDPSVETVWCILSYEGEGESLEYGAPYWLDVREAETLYREMGRVFRPKAGWSYAIISPHEEFEKLFGRPADKRRKLYNGMLKCQVYMYYK